MSGSILKKLVIVAVILLGLLIVYLYRQVPHSQAPFAKAETKSEHIVLAQGAKRVELRKQGNAWIVSSATSTVYPVEDGQVKTLLSGLQAAQVEDEISDRPDRAAEFEVNSESGTRVQVFMAGEQKLGEGIFGKQAADFAHMYFRYPDKPNVYLVRGLFRGDLGLPEVKVWRSHALVNIPETKFQAIMIEGMGFKTDLVRASTDVWTMNGKNVEPTPVNALVGALAHLRADDFVDPAAYPQLTFESLKEAHIVVRGTDSTAELLVGREDSKKKNYPVSIGKGAGLAWISEYSAKAILQQPSAFKEKK